MNKKNIKISYDKDSRVLVLEMKKARSVDSEIKDNIVIDYDKKGKVVRVNIYDFSFNDFRESSDMFRNFVRNYRSF